MKTVIFDLDGTILDTIEDIAGAVNYILEKYEMPLRTVKEVRMFVGNGLLNLLKRCVPKGTADETIKEMFPDFVAFYKSHDDIRTKPYDGIPEAIKELKEKGYKLAVASNKRQEAVEDLCHKFYEGLFDDMAGDKEGFNIKPAPDMIERIMNNLGTVKSDVIYVGDSEVDILTSSNADIKGIFVSWGFRDKELLKEKGAEIIVDSPDELIEMIEKC